jgi:conjugal transfer pilus assembly protein TraB
MIKDGSRARAVRKRQMMIAGMAAAVVMVVAGAAAVFVNGNSSAPGTVAAVPAETKPIVTGGAAYNQQDLWRTQVSTEIAGLRKQLDDYKAKDAEEARKQKGQAEMDRLKGAGTAAPPQPPASSAAADPAPTVFAPPVPPPPGAGKGGVANAKGSAANPLFNAPPAPVAPNAGEVPLKGSIGSIKFGESTEAAVATTVAGASTGLQQLQPVGSGSLSAVGGGQSNGDAGDESGGQRDRKQAGSYIPAGTFVRIIVLNGLDAPTGGSAQSSPAPVLLKIIDSATMANGYKANLAGCILTANGYGEVSSERANIRLDRLSCISENGGAIDIAVKGYVAGEDGKSGMRGRLVTKTGQILANALLAGIGSGIGQAFSASSTTTTTNPFGGTSQNVNPGKELQAGLSAGVGKAFDTLAKYYVTLADKTFPIIEVDGARVADVVFSRGFTLEGR